ncbi:17-beta-hydroxysteroid dehydrogenase 13 [Pseudolycoriella hygida]|uniref:Short-chain dehydrogenase/reductase 3 n=1 Tax=Pseudolycoriella hygida TaxID=35572 RepID=A0A9Q0MS36_9DIPT|nr:17-beta-hydroxysteroid dehydrogenase 13 [Pseudolycoriella hygida]
MQNISESGRVSYVAADPLKKIGWFKKIIFWILVLVDAINVLVLSIPNWITSVYHCVISPPRKCIKGQTVLITGGGNGIGKALAYKLAEKGCNIAIADIEWNAAQATAKDLQAKNVIAKAYHVDVADVDQIKELKKNIETDIAPVDILINNAALIPLLSLREGSEMEIERIVRVNITSHFYMTRAFLPGMILRKLGHIVGISSITAVHPMPGAVIYSATKFAVNGFIQALYQELRQEGNDFINLTSVLPYFVSTRKDLTEAVNLRFPMMSAEEVAEVTVDAMLRNEQIVSVPRYNLLLSAFLNTLSLPNQCLIRDYVFKEREARQVFYKEKESSNAD